MRRLLRHLFLVGSVTTLIGGSASVASARDNDPPAPRYEVTPSLAMPTRTKSDDDEAARSSLTSSDTQASVDPPTPDRTFYGWQNMVVGYAGIGMLAASMRGGGALPWFGLGVYALGGPIVHLAHQEYGRAAGSLVINVLTPVLVGAVAHSMDKGCAGREECGLDAISGMIGGVVFGMLAAPLIDGITMGWEDAPRKPPPAIAVQPTVTIARKEQNGASTTMFGLAGAF